jgi:glycerate dehydrogenase
MKLEVPQPRIVVLDGYALSPGDNPWDCVAALGALRVHDRTAVGQVLDSAAEADILLTNKTPVSGPTIEALEKLRYISVLATGYDIVDIRAAGATASSPGTTHARRGYSLRITFARMATP